MRTELKTEIEVTKEMIDETLADNEFDIDEKLDFCDAIIKYLREEKKGIEDFVAENDDEDENYEQIS